MNDIKQYQFEKFQTIWRYAFGKMLKETPFNPRMWIQGRMLEEYNTLLEILGDK